MESKELKSVLEKEAGVRVLEHGAFGRTGPAFVRVGPEDLRATLTYARDRMRPCVKWLEHLSAWDYAGAIVLSYFLRSADGNEQVVVRCALEPGPDDSLVDAPGVSDLFETAPAPEAEISALFGVRFTGDGYPKRGFRELLASEYQGFPMRKGASGHA